MALESGSSEYPDEFERKEVINGIRLGVHFNTIHRSFDLTIEPMEVIGQPFMDKRGVTRQYDNIMSTLTDDPDIAQRLFEKACRLAGEEKNAKEIFETMFNSVDYDEATGKGIYDFS